ncbi:hypothetical protein JG688_00016750, partial [Phytophthora aleatoria]
NLYIEKNTQEEIKTSLLATSDITPRELCVFIGFLLLGQFPLSRRNWNIIGNLLMKARFHEVALASSCQATTSCTFPEIYISVATRILALQATVRGNIQIVLQSNASIHEGQPHKWGTKLFMLCCSA